MISTDQEEKEGKKSFMCAIHRLKDVTDEDMIPDPMSGVVPFKDVRFFIDIQAYNLMFEYDLYEYTCVETDYAREEYAKKYKVNIPITARNYLPNFDEVSIKLRKDFEDIIPKVIYIYTFLDVYKDVTKPNDKEKYANIIVLLSYIICWIYILIISIHTLKMEDILDVIEMIQNTYKNVPNPFIDIVEIYENKFKQY
jgi:hypothetical protein